MSTAAQHHTDCEWHHDQYDAECTCGAVHSREPTAEMILAGVVELSYLDLESDSSEQVVRAVYRAMEEARSPVPPVRGSDNKEARIAELEREVEQRDEALRRIMRGLDMVLERPSPR